MGRLSFEKLDDEANPHDKHILDISKAKALNWSSKWFLSLRLSDFVDWFLFNRQENCESIVLMRLAVTQTNERTSLSTRNQSKVAEYSVLSIPITELDLG